MKTAGMHGSPFMAVANPCVDRPQVAIDGAMALRQ